MLAKFSTTQQRAAYNCATGNSLEGRQTNAAENSAREGLAEYQTATNEEFKGNTLARFLRHDIPDVLRTMLHGFSATNDTDYIVEDSAGQGQWTRCPWVAVFDPVVTDSAQRGYYPVYLFREDFTGVYLSLNLCCGTCTLMPM